VESPAGSCPFEYFASDFVDSAYGIFFKNQELYPVWAGRVANEVAQRLEKGEGFRDVLAFVGKERVALASAQGERGPEYFGGVFQPPSGSTFHIFREGRPPQGTYAVHGAMAENRMVRAGFGGIPDRKKLASGQVVEGPLYNYYHPLSGEPIRASALKKIVRLDSDGKLVTSYGIDHPHDERILTDVLARLELIRGTANLSEETKTREFLAAMYGYYNAPPFPRGSSAIGRAFFAGTYLKFFGKKIPTLPDGIDITAMLNDQDEFIAAQLPLFR
jgi:hypothetical protein